MSKRERRLDYNADRLATRAVLKMTHTELTCALEKATARLPAELKYEYVDQFTGEILEASTVHRELYVFLEYVSELICVARR